MREFGKESVFMDVSTIQPGLDFRKVIDQNVATCGVLLAIIGVNWIDAKNEAGERRLEDPADFVRLETASALKRDIPVIPVLVRSARMPGLQALPEDLKELAYRNAVEITFARWNYDVQRLIDALRPFVDTPAKKNGEPPNPKPQPAPFPEPLPSSRHPLLLKLVIGLLSLLILTAVVRYIVSPSGVMVPDVSGSTLPAATTKLEASGLAVGTTSTRVDPAAEANTVIAQSTAAGVTVSKRTKIDLVLSPPLVEVPNVVGKSLDFAQGALQERQLRVGEIQKEPRQGAANNTVLRELPSSDKSVKPGTKIDLVVAEEVPNQVQSTPSNQKHIVRATVKVPNVIGKTSAQARTELQETGLSVGNTTGQAQHGVAPGTVVTQSPAAGQEVQKGSPVDFTVAESPPVKKPAAGSPQGVTVTVASTRDENSNRPSPPATAQCRFADGRSINMAYSSSPTRGRKIFGSLVPYGQVWRAGANEATSFVTTANLLVEGKDVPAGHYTIFAIPNPDKWTLIISKKTGEWGIPYPEGDDLLRVDMRISQLPSQVENFTISFDPAGRNCNMRIDWENTRASAEFAEKK